MCLVLCLVVQWSHCAVTLILYTRQARVSIVQAQKKSMAHPPRGSETGAAVASHNSPLNKHLGNKKRLTYTPGGITIPYMSKTTTTTSTAPSIPTADSLSLWREHALIQPQTPELMDFYINLISTHHLPLHTMFDEDSNRCKHHQLPLYFPESYSQSIPPWGVVYYFWRRDGDSSFLDTLSEVEEEVLSTTHLDESLSSEDIQSHKLSTSKYSLIKAHYSNPSKSTSLRNRKTQATLSHLSNESIRELIAALTAPQAPQAPQAATLTSITAPKPITIHEDDL